MIKEKEKMLEKLRSIKQTAEEYFEANNFENYVVKNVFLYKKQVELVSKVTKQKKKFTLYAVQAENVKPKMGGDATFELEYLEDKEGNIYTISDLIKEYEGFESIKDVVDKAKENEERPEEEQDKEKQKYTLQELEEEKEQEKEGSKDKKAIYGPESPKKKRKPKHIIERVNPGKAQMDYWQTVKQACGLPEKVHTLAFAYPTSSEDKVDYADITIYMLDKDGYIIDDLDIDDYFEFDSSTGNNPIQDNVVRHEKDENEGMAQIEEHRTMIRLFAKNSKDRNTYISLEQKNGLGDYNDINAGRKTIAGTQNVEKQLETDRVLTDWDSEEEKIMNPNRGKYNMNDIFKEAEQHKTHGDEKFVSSLNADGYEQTVASCESQFVPDTNITWEQFSKSVGNKNIDELMREFFEQYNVNNGQVLLLRMQAEYKENAANKKLEGEVIGTNFGKYYDGAGGTNGRREGPWDSTKY